MKGRYNLGPHSARPCGRGYRNLCELTRSPLKPRCGAVGPTRLGGPGSPEDTQVRAVRLWMGLTGCSSRWELDVPLQVCVCFPGDTDFRASLRVQGLERACGISVHSLYSSVSIARVNGLLHTHPRPARFLFLFFILLVS